MVLNGKAVKIENIALMYYDYNKGLKGVFDNKNSFLALNDINLIVKKGEIFALLGRNGAGKSTLLRAIGGLIRPHEGKIETQGRVILLAGADPGFDKKLTGNENIRQLGRAYGINDDEIDEFVKSIIEFAQLGESINRNFGGYSTGMKGKLGFGFITALRPEILLIDETLGVGDREFRGRAQNRLRQFIESSGTVIISTHSLGLAKEICTKGVVLDKGRLIFEGDIKDAIQNYIELTD